jgi:hypothetical protein
VGLNTKTGKSIDDAGVALSGQRCEDHDAVSVTRVGLGGLTQGGGGKKL